MRFSCIVKRWISWNKVMASGTDTLVMIPMPFRRYTLKRSFYSLGNMLSMPSASLETSITVDVVYCTQ